MFLLFAPNACCFGCGEVFMSFSILGFRVFAWILTAQCIAGVQTRWLFVGVGFARRKPMTLSSFLFER